MSRPALSDFFIFNKMEDLKPIIESLLFVAEVPLTIDRIKITKSTGMQASGLSAFQTIRVEVTVRDGRSAEEIMKDSYVRQLIREHYLEDHYLVYYA